MKIRLPFTLLVFLVVQSCAFSGKEFHVSPTGNDTNDGSKPAPLKTIQAAADKAQPGDVITVHAGTYRERITPPRGGSADGNRITYQAAEGELVRIKGSEVIKGWEHLQDDTWKVVVPNAFFGEFNPYRDLINGDWFSPLGREHHTGAVYLNGHWLTEAPVIDSLMKPAGKNPFWFGVADTLKEGSTTLWAQFAGMDPNQQEVEINVRQTVFYPKLTGINYLTIKGFTLEQAATPWAPPTAEQIGLIGTNWSKCWVIENNIVRYSICVGIALGKHGDQWDNTSANSAEGYVKTIERAVERGWSKENIGHHIVRNNHISHCEQAGVVGSMGAVFSEISGNDIHDIHIRQLFSGAEMAGIKIHGSIDCVISNNHIYHCNRGIWLDWMAHGTRVTQNFLHDNGPSEDIFMEVNHGPALIDNNLLLSANSILVNSQGEAFVHNIIAGRIYVITGEDRLTPYQKAHSTEVVGLAKNPGGDERYYNNILVGKADLGAYDRVILPMWMDGNIYLAGAKPGKVEAYPLVLAEFDPNIRVTEQKDGWYLDMRIDPKWANLQLRKLVTTELLGFASTPDLPFEQFDGSPYRLDQDFFGDARNVKSPFPGPFVLTRYDQMPLKIWPRD